MTIALVIHSKTSGSNHTTDAVDTTGANLIVVFAANFNQANVTDNKTNTWTALTVKLNADPSAGQLFYCFNPTVGTGHTFSSGSFAGMGMLAFSGAASSPFDVQNGATAALQPGSITPSVDNEVVVCGLCQGGTIAAPTAIDSSFTISDTRNGTSGSFYGFGLAYLIQTTAGAVNPTWTASSSAFPCVIASFKAAAAGGATSGWGGLLAGVRNNALGTLN